MAKIALVTVLLSVAALSSAQFGGQVFTLDGNSLGGQFVTLDASSIQNAGQVGQLGQLVFTAAAPQQQQQQAQFVTLAAAAPQQQNAQVLTLAAPRQQAAQVVTLQAAAAPITTSGAAVTRRQELRIEHQAQPRAAAIVAPVQQEIRTVAIAEQPRQQQAQLLLVQQAPVRQEVRTVQVEAPRPQPQQLLLIQQEQPRQEVHHVVLQPVAAPRTTQRPTTTTTTTTTPAPTPALLQVAPIVARAPVQQRVSYGVKGGRLFRR